MNNKKETTSEILNKFRKDRNTMCRLCTKSMGPGSDEFMKTCVGCRDLDNLYQKDYSDDL